MYSIRQKGVATNLSKTDLSWPLARRAAVEPCLKTFGNPNSEQRKRNFLEESFVESGHRSLTSLSPGNKLMEVTQPKEVTPLARVDLYTWEPWLLELSDEENKLIMKETFHDVWLQ